MIVMIDNFIDHEVDGDTTPGPDSLQELIQKVGLRVKEVTIFTGQQ